MKQKSNYKTLNSQYKQNLINTNKAHRCEGKEKKGEIQGVGFNMLEQIDDSMTHESETREQTGVQNTKHNEQ